MSDRIRKAFKKKEKKLVTFTTGGDPDLDTSLEILNTIISNGIDIIEIGMPFSDPMADGPTIQESSVRSIAGGTKINDILEAANSIYKIEKKKTKNVEKKDILNKNDILTLNNQAKSNKSEILVLDQMIE